MASQSQQMVDVQNLPAVAKAPSWRNQWTPAGVYTLLSLLLLSLVLVLFICAMRGDYLGGIGVLAALLGIGITIAGFVQYSQVIQPQYEANKWWWTRRARGLIQN